MSDATALVDYVFMTCFTFTVLFVFKRYVFVFPASWKCVFVCNVKVPYSTIAHAEFSSPFLRPLSL